MRPLLLAVLLAGASLLASPAQAQTLAQACPADVQAHANAEGTITLTWSAVPGATGYRIHREVDGGPWQVDYALVPPAASPSFTDANATAGVTYHYRVMSQNTREGVDACAPVEATALTSVPFFPTPLALVLATAGAGAAAALVVLRRR